jgi:hypothetical protein
MRDIAGLLTGCLRPPGQIAATAKQPLRHPSKIIVPLNQKEFLMPNTGGGPIILSRVQPCPPANQQLALFVPDTVLEAISDEQRVKIALIQTEFAQRVALLLGRSYNEITEVIRGGSREAE